MHRKNLLVDADYKECINRINQLTRDTQPLWGKMNITQMFAHCTEVQNVMSGKKELSDTPLFAKMIKGFIRKGVLGDKPFPQDLRTHPQYIIENCGPFEEERERLQEALGTLRNLTEAERRQINHPLFGEMTDEELGWGSYKHLDHHLNQFGV